MFPSVVLQTTGQKSSYSPEAASSFQDKSPAKDVAQFPYWYRISIPRRLHPLPSAVRIACASGIDALPPMGTIETPVASSDPREAITDTIITVVELDISLKSSHI
ncbi:MAG: hypothetical protein Q7K57_53325 [Burkholderiaceae bacterium]|nr:hypothetical protein [Burkholderiaceae bacterium]